MLDVKRNLKLFWQAAVEVADRVLPLLHWCRRSRPGEAAFQKGYFYLQNLDQEIRSTG